MKFIVSLVGEKYDIAVEAVRFAVDLHNGPPCLFFYHEDAGRPCTVIAPGRWVSVRAPDAVVPEVEDSDDA